MNISDETRFALEDLIEKIVEDELVEDLITAKTDLLKSTTQQMNNIDLGIRILADALESIGKAINRVANAMEEQNG